MTVTHRTKPGASRLRDFSFHRTVHTEPNAKHAPYSSRVSLVTTSFLTAAILVYTIGAGITADAGTRLALQLILVGNF